MHKLTDHLFVETKYDWANVGAVVTDRPRSHVFEYPFSAHTVTPLVSLLIDSAASITARMILS